MFPKPATPAGPVTELFDALHELYRAAGGPPARVIMQRLGPGRHVSHSMVHKVLCGPQVPAWPDVELVLRALDGDKKTFERLWKAAHLWRPAQSDGVEPPAEADRPRHVFHLVHQDAARTAAENAALRTAVGALFLNLARRSQALVDRMIGELDAMERAEEDPKRLAQLFQLDHLATRLRRNDENLLIVAGADAGPPRRKNALFVDTLRAAQSEVELYNRIEFGSVVQDVEVVASAVNDVVRLLAELLDNATRFSPPTSMVVVSARRIDADALVSIEDNGVGASDEQLAALNQRLTSAAVMDVSTFRMMGLAVVNRLAARHKIGVELRPNPQGGLIAVVRLPGELLASPRADPRA